MQYNHLSCFPFAVKYCTVVQEIFACLIFVSKYFHTKVNVRNFPNTSIFKKIPRAFLYCTVCTEWDRSKLKYGRIRSGVLHSKIYHIYKDTWSASTGDRRTGLQKRGTQCCHASCRHPFATSLLARAIACEGRLWKRQPVGSGNPFYGF